MNNSVSTGYMARFVGFGLALLLLLLVSCGGPAAGTGDPGNKRLDQLASDAIFSSMPPGATAVGPLVKTPAAWRDNGWFEPSGWNGPSVTRNLVTSQPDAMFAFYAARTSALGWNSNGNRNTAGYPQVWSKEFAGGWQASLSLIETTPRATVPGGFALNASGAAIS